MLLLIPPFTETAQSVQVHSQCVSMKAVHQHKQKEKKGDKKFRADSNNVHEQGVHEHPNTVHEQCSRTKFTNTGRTRFTNTCSRTAKRTAFTNSFHEHLPNTSFTNIRTSFRSALTKNGQGCNPHLLFPVRGPKRARCVPPPYPRGRNTVPACPARGPST